MKNMEYELRYFDNYCVSNAFIKRLETLSLSDRLIDRISVAINKNTPIYILEQLRFDNSITVKLELINNPNCPKYLIKIIQDEIRDEIRDKTFFLTSSWNSIKLRFWDKINKFSFSSFGFL